MFYLLVFISLLACCNSVIAVTLNASLLAQLGYSNQSSSFRISYFDITDIDPNAFKGYSKVTFLDFSYTKLAKLDLSVFKDMVNLWSLYLQNNPLSQLTNTKKVKFPYLQNFIFDGSQLAILDTNVINAMPNLLQLNIDNNNQLSQIKPNQLSGLKKLQFLTLTTKNQVSLTKAHFTGLNSLLQLQFQSSNIKTIEAQTLLALPNVGYVDFSNNALTSLDYLKIPNKLMYLILEGNKINFFRFSNTIGVIKHLSLGNNQFRSFKSMNFSMLANLTSIDLSNNPHAFPNEIAGHLIPLVNLNKLGLSNLSISSIDSNIFRNNSKLYTINLSNNKISLLPFNIFSNLKGLNNLDLSNNQLSVLDNRTFVGLNNMYDIFLQSNKLAKISARTFFNISKSIGNMWLSDNLISEIDNSAFFGCSYFLNLDLSKNRLTKLSPRIFENLTINTLSLNNNQITEIDNSTFAAVKSIVNLYLNTNNIFRIGPGTFNSVNITGFLDLSYNQLTKLDNNTFAGQNQLTNINLSYNKISTIEAGAFRGLTNMQYIYLNDNNITYLDNSTFAGCNNLQTISLYNNPKLSKTNLQSLCPTTAVNCKVYYNLIN